MTYISEATTQAARKRHRCTWCWQHIEIGETYKRYFYADGDTGTVKAHPECYDAIQEYAAEEGGYYTWVPGMERPERQSTPTTDAPQAKGSEVGNV